MTDAISLLRQAEALISEHGHTRGDYVDAGLGSLCLDGALRAAVTGLRQQGNGEWNHGPFLDPVPESYIVAQNAVAELLPDRCREHASSEDCGYCDRDMALTGSPMRVHHFNDFACTGEDEARLILSQAREKLEAAE